MDPDTIEPLIEALLDEHPDGLEEQHLLRRLREIPGSGLPRERAIGGLALFRVHFLLFHTLYRLRDRLRLDRTGDLAIDPMCIRRCVYRPAPAGLGEHDRLRAYYLDLRNLRETDAADVERLLRGFQAEMDRRERRAAALATLELEEPADASCIRRQYRRLAMRHHPDRGGDAQRLQEIHDALAVLVPRHGA